jgi:hypothetical protein
MQFEDKLRMQKEQMLKEFDKDKKKLEASFAEKLSRIEAEQKQEITAMKRITTEKCQQEVQLV